MPTCSAIAPSTGRRCRSKPQPGFETCRRHRAHENGIVNAQCTAQTQRGAQCRMQARPGYNTCLRHATVEQQQPVRQPPRVAGGQRGQAPLVELTIQQVRDLCYLVSEGFSTADIMVVLGIPNEPEPPVVPPAAPRRQTRRRANAPNNRRRNNADADDGSLKPHHIDIITRALCDAPVDTTCAVCISDYPDMIAPVETDCGHVFCKACITDWACTHKHNSCPACRKELL